MSEHDMKEDAAPIAVFPKRKIRVFLSSKCGDKGKFDNIRKKLRVAIERTNLADVYAFEAESSSTLSAEKHYIWGLEDSDVCIFLIDNADGVPSGVQREIDTAERCKIKSLYYFCDERSSEKTPLEKRLKGATFAKSQTVHHFDELAKEGAQALVNDIVDIYRHYCKNRLVSQDDFTEDYTHSVSLPSNFNYPVQTVPNTVIKNIDKCKAYIMEMTVGYSLPHQLEETVSTCAIDEWGVQFLEVLFEGISIKNFNVGMFLDSVRAVQDAKYFQVVNMRWMAIQAYFTGDVEKCIQLLESARTQAIETKQPQWVVNDILIDLRNQQWNANIFHYAYSYPSAQTDLDNSTESVYYPVLDRIHDSLQEEYIKGLYNKRIESPFTISYGRNFTQCCDLLASSYVVAIYNGSLTHILLLYRKLRDFAFYLCSLEEDWNYRKDLLKYEVFAGDQKAIKRVLATFPEILNSMNDADAAEIMRFCRNQPVAFKKLKSQFLAMGAVGYYLNDEDYTKYEKTLLQEIRSWFDGPNPIVELGKNIIDCLSGIAFRMSQDDMAEICCLFLEKHYSLWFIELFNFMAGAINLNKMRAESAERLVHDIIAVFNNEKERNLIGNAPDFLCHFRMQNHRLTEELDRLISEYFPRFYQNDYRINTIRDSVNDYPVLIKEEISSIKKDNATQGKDGVFFASAFRHIARVRFMLLDDHTRLEEGLMESLILAVSDTLLLSYESVSIKLDAISLLICIAVKFPKDYNRNESIYKKIIEEKEKIPEKGSSDMFSNIDKEALKVALSLLETAMGGDGYKDFLEGMALIHNNVATSISITNIITEYFETGNLTVLPSQIETVILQNVLQWLQCDNLKLRTNAAGLLFPLARNPENEGLINQVIIRLTDTESAYIKNLIQRRISTAKGIHKTTREYVFSKCMQDSCYVVRMVAAEEHVVNFN